MPEVPAEPSGLSPAQRALAQEHGIATEYVDWRGQQTVAPATTVVALLAALGVAAATPEEASASLAAAREAGQHALPRCIVTTAAAPTTVSTTAAAPSRAWVELEDGARVDLEAGDATLVVPAGLPLGYHRLCVDAATSAAECALIVTPDRLQPPPGLGSDRAWGLTAQLYSVRSSGSWGVGDLADLRRLAVWSRRELGSDFVLVNPLSAAEPVGKMEPSPYLPSARAFTNPVYLRIEDIAEYADLPPGDRAQVDGLHRDVLEALGGVDGIDRDRSWAAKAAALRLLHKAPRTPGRERAYRAFVRREGGPLRDFATWCAAAMRYGTDWHEWPAELGHPDSAGAAELRDQAADDVDFAAWLQWLLDEQLGAAQQEAIDAGMRLGIMHDLAVGVHPSGADSWVLQDIFAKGVCVGAPPDGFNQMGQNWSQPPWRPDQLAASGYAPYRHLIGRLLRHAGALRIDHVIGLFRLWCIPDGAPPGAGTYLHLDHEALVGILALEAHRAEAVVVGEDLGNVLASTREYLLKRGLLGTSILWFERDADGRPLAAERWRECCLASVTTHDLPPTAGYLAGDHVELRHRLGLLTRPVDEERAADLADRDAWLAVLEERGLLHPGADPQRQVEALYRYLGSTPSRLLAVALTDAVGERRTQNQPGTSDEYPNWRVPLAGPDGEPMLLEDVERSDRARRLAAIMRTAVQSARM